MAKLIVVLLLTFFAYSVLAAPTKTDEIRTKLEKVRDEALSSIATLNLDNVERRRAIVSHSSEFAQKVQEAVNKIFKTFVRVDERNSHRILPQVALRLNDIVHEVQEILITRPSALKRTLKENIGKVSGEVAKLLEVLQHFTENHDEARLGHDVNDIADKLIDAIHQLRLRSDVHHQTHLDNGQHHESFGKDVINTLNKISWYDPDVYHQLSRTVRNFDHTLSHILHEFRNEVFHFEGKNRDDFQEIVKVLEEIRSHLNIVLRRAESADLHRQIEDLKVQLRLTVRNVDAQMQRLVQLGHSLTGERTVVVGNIIRNVVADCLHGEQRVLWKLQDILRSHNVEITV